jgi:hypothetical protein
MVAQISTLTCGFVLMAGVAGLSVPPHTHAASCEAIVGQWAWFTGGAVTMHSDGTIVHAFAVRRYVEQLLALAV